MPKTLILAPNSSVVPAFFGDPEGSSINVGGNIPFRTYNVGENQYTYLFITGKTKQVIIDEVAYWFNKSNFDGGQYCHPSLTDPETVSIWLFGSGYWFTVGTGSPQNLPASPRRSNN